MHERSGWAGRAAGAALTAALAAVSACVLDPAGEPAAPDPAVGSTSAAIIGGQCPDFGCGANSPMVDTALLFHELSLVGNGKTAPATLPDATGLAIVAAGEAHRAQIVQAGRSYDLAVVDGRFVGSCLGCKPLAGPDLVGAQITVTLKGVPRYVITITTVREMRYFLGSGTTAAYTLLWNDLAGGPTTNLCNNIKLLEDQIAQQKGDEGYATQELMGMQTFESVVFEGDRVDSHAKTMSPAPDDSWFNIGCASHTLSKLRLTQNTVHSQTAAQPQAWERRQATLKLLTADYCNSGIPLTVAGQRLVWQGDLMSFFSPPKNLEARWTETGASCLISPRMLYPTSSLGASTFPKIWTAIDTACKSVGMSRPPPCKDPDPSNPGGLRISANPR
jgi:ADYC domain-containing protein